MFRQSHPGLTSARHQTAPRRGRTPQVIELEPRFLLAASDLTTMAQVTAITGGVSVIQPLKTDYAINSDSFRVDFTASDPDDPGSMPVIHFQVTDLTTNSTVTGTGSSVSFSAQGLYSVQFWSTDSDDSEMAGAHSILIGLDRTSPSVIIASVTPSTLWPPNGKFVTVTVSGTATDSLTGVNPSSLSFRVVDEYGMVQPSGPITDTVEASQTAFGGDGMVQFTFQVQLQARRHGFDFDGRQYAIVVNAMDEAGNLGSTTAVVTVPHDRGHHSRHSAGGVGETSPGQLGGSGGLSGASGHHGKHAKSTDGSSHGHRHHQDTASNPGLFVPTLPTLPVLDPGDGQGHGKAGHGNGHGHGHGHGG
jgi:hypothetical protein